MKNIWQKRETARWSTLLGLLSIFFLFPSQKFAILLYAWTIIQMVNGHIKSLKRDNAFLYFVRMTLYFLPYGLVYFVIFWGSPVIQKSNSVLLSCILSIGMFSFWVNFNRDSLRIKFSKEIIASSLYIPKHVIFFHIYNKIGSAICEELFFRGVILSSGIPMYLAVFLSVFLFWFSHWGTPWGSQFEKRESIEQVLLGIVCAIFFLSSKSVLPGIMLHLLINLTVSLDLILRYDRWFLRKEKYDKILKDEPSYSELDI